MASKAASPSGAREQMPCGAAVAPRLVPPQAGSGLVPPRSLHSTCSTQGGISPAAPPSGWEVGLSRAGGGRIQWGRGGCTPGQSRGAVGTLAQGLAPQRLRGPVSIRVLGVWPTRLPHLSERGAGHHDAQFRGTVHAAPEPRGAARFTHTFLGVPEGCQKHQAAGEARCYAHHFLCPPGRHPVAAVGLMAPSTE